MTSIRSSIRNFFKEIDTHLENIYSYIEEGTTRDAVVSIIGSTIITLAASKGDPRSLFILYTSQLVEVLLMTMIKMERDLTFLKNISEEQKKFLTSKDLTEILEPDQKAIRNKIKKMLPVLRSSDKCAAFVISYLMGMGLALYMGFKMHYKTSVSLVLGIYAINYYIVKKLSFKNGEFDPVYFLPYYLATLPLPIIGISVTK